MSNHYIPGARSNAASTEASAGPLHGQSDGPLYTGGLQRLPVQCKLAVGPVDDPMEKQADAMAEKVMRTPATPFIQRKCAHCEDKDQQARRKPLGAGAGGGSAGQAVTSHIESTKGGGSSLPEPTRSFMESRFGADFSDVRVHAGGDAARVSNELNAQAFTLGKDIYFNAGKYSPDSDGGKHLLAHELTHTLQQEEPSANMIRREGEPGTSILVDRASSSRNPKTPGIVEGQVERSEYKNEQEKKKGNTINHTMVGVRFDENECKIYVPRKVQFVNQTKGDPTTCGDLNGGKLDPAKPVPAADFRRIANNFLQSNNEGLNGWFQILLTNAPKSPCNDRHIPIIVQVEEVTSNPDTTVVITGNKGRSYVSGDDKRSMAVLCDDPGSETMIHESGHMTLGYGDEYSERDAGNPAEREHETEFSRMAETGASRLQIFHERHFNFVAEFMRSVYPGCQADLVYGERSRYKPSFGPTFSFGGVGGDISGLYISLGLDMGIPLDHLRRTEILLGPRLSLLTGLTPQYDEILAVLYGVRLSLSRTFVARMFNQQIPIGAGAYGEIGGGHNFDPGKRLPSDFPYGEAGVFLGYRGNLVQLGISAGVGELNLGGSGSLSYGKGTLDLSGRF